jgi:hypothetical protein
LVSASYNGAPILLQSGQEYFFAVVGVNFSFVAWAILGSSSVPLFNAVGSSWFNLGPTDVQFQVFGTPVAAVPEPSTWAMMLLGFAGLGFAFRRSQRKAAMSNPVCVRAA